MKPEIQLSGQDGNAYNLLGIAHRAAMKAGWPRQKWSGVLKEATQGDYDNLIQTLMKYFEVK